MKFKRKLLIVLLIVSCVVAIGIGGAKLLSQRNNGCSEAIEDDSLNESEGYHSDSGDFELPLLPRK